MVATLARRGIGQNAQPTGPERSSCTLRCNFDPARLCETAQTVHSAAPMLFALTEPARAGTRYQTTSLVTTQSPGDASEADTAGPPSVHSTLSPSLREDLLRFVDEDTTIELLPAIAACLRHARPVSLRLDLGGLAVTATIHPREQLFRSVLDLGALSPGECRRLTLVAIEPDETVSYFAGRDRPSGPLRPLLWRLAMHGARAELLPELEGPVRYRLAYGAAPVAPDTAPELLRVLGRLRTVPLSLDEIAAGSGLAPAVVQRLLNALYLQSGLMVVRAFGVRG